MFTTNDKIFLFMFCGNCLGQKVCIIELGTMYYPKDHGLLQTSFVVKLSCTLHAKSLLNVNMDLIYIMI